MEPEERIVLDAEPLGWLHFHYGGHVESYSHHRGRREMKCLIDRDARFDIGRDQIYEAFGIYDPTISRHHLRIHCVLFDDPTDDRVPPLIYARVLSSNAVILLTSTANRTAIAREIRKGDGDILLLNGDELRLTSRVRLVFRVQAEEHNVNHLSDENITETKCFATEYELTGRLLGSGVTSSVFLASQTSTRQQIACKVVPLYTLEKVNSTGRILAVKQNQVTREYAVLKDLNHPNIAQLKKVFRSKSNLYIMQELITGGDLLAWMERTGPSTEPQTAVIIRQLLNAVEYLHDRYIVHRDIKPENVLLTSWRDGARIVLTDFGQATNIETKTNATGVVRTHSVIGTPGYTAPEMVKARGERVERDYCKAVDIWSVGCIAANLPINRVMFSGKENLAELTGFPAPGTTTPCHPVSLRDLDTSEEWQKFSGQMKSFIKDCLLLDRTRRPSAKQALLHPWFTHETYAVEIEAAYQRAIQDWKPRDRDQNIVELITVKPRPPVPAFFPQSQVDQYANETKSRHFSGYPGQMITPTRTQMPRGTNHISLPTISESYQDSPPESLLDGPYDNPPENSYESQTLEHEEEEVAENLQDASSRPENLFRAGHLDMLAASQDDMGESPTLERVTNQEAMLENTLLMPNSQERLSRLSTGAFVSQSSIVDFEPPWSQLPPTDSREVNGASDENEMIETQVMFDDTLVGPNTRASNRLVSPTVLSRPQKRRLDPDDEDIARDRLLSITRRAFESSDRSTFQLAEMYT